MAGFGTAGTVGKYGLGLSMLAAAFGQFRGDNADAFTGTADSWLSTDTLKWALSFFMSEEDIENSKLLEAMDGNEGPINVLLGSLLVLPGKTKWAGVAAAVGWIAYNIYNSDPDNKLTSLFNGDPYEYSLTPDQLAELDIPKPTTVSAAAAMAAIAADPSKAGALDATEIAATRVLADADEAARIQTASATAAEAVISDAKLVTAERLAGKLNNGMADAAEVTAAGTGRHGMIAPEEMELAAVLGLDEPELDNEG